MLLASCIKKKLATGLQWLVVRESFFHPSVMVQFVKTPQNSQCSILQLLSF